MRDLAITFAGGGNRAFYQYGLMRRWGPRLLPRTAALVACSAGACVALMLLSGREAAGRDIFLRRTRGLTKNFRWSNLLLGRRPAPHAAILEDVLLALAAEGGLDRIREQPFPVLVLTSGFPRAMPSPLAAAVGIAAYQIERRLRPNQLHPRLGQALAFEPIVFDLRACAGPEEAAALILASSATPPFTPVGRFGGRPLLDGGMVDNAPAFIADGLPDVRRNLVILTRPYAPGLAGRRGTRLYIAPLERVPIERWDYTRPDALDATVAQGEREADVHQPLLDAFLADA